MFHHLWYCWWHCSVWYLLSLSALNVRTKLWWTFQAIPYYIMSLSNTQKYVLHSLPLVSARMGTGLGSAEEQLLLPLLQVGFEALASQQRGSRNRKPWSPTDLCLLLVPSPLDPALHWPLLTSLQLLIHKSFPSHWFSKYHSDPLQVTHHLDLQLEYLSIVFSNLLAI